MPENLELRGRIYYFRAQIDGKLYRISTGFSDPKLAQRFAVDKENEIRKGNLGWIRPRVPAFDDWAVTYLAAYHPNRATERLLFRRPIKRWGTRRIDELVRSDFESYLRDREREGAMDGTLERERVLLKGCFQAAMADGLLTKNPLDGIRRYRPDARTRVMTRDEEARIRAIVRPRWNRYLTVMLGTGLRSGELRGLRPMDLREDGTWLWVRPESNKTRKGRSVPLRPDVQAALAEQRIARKIDTDDKPYWAMHSSTPRMMLSRACEKLKIEPPISVHDLRRTFATRCADAELYPRHLQRILGHSNIETTMRFYVAQERVTLSDALEKVKL